MFLGEYFHCLDSKNRLRLPAKFKKFCSEDLVLTKGNSDCLFVLPKEKFSTVFSKALDLPLFDENAQKPLRMLFSSAVEIEEDNQGRFLLPANLKAFAGIDKEIVFVGAGNRIEIWAKEKWQKYCNLSFDLVVKELGKYGV